MANNLHGDIQKTAESVLTPSVGDQSQSKVRHRGSHGCPRIGQQDW
ncbi:hypothetical protein [Candidatus Hamiltonella defensa]|nr:hypothetical protein [Candidatus Hamiltonella defensa]